MNSTEVKLVERSMETMMNERNEPLSVETDAKAESLLAATATPQAAGQETGTPVIESEQKAPMGSKKNKMKKVDLKEMFGDDVPPPTFIQEQHQQLNAYNNHNQSHNNNTAKSEPTPVPLATPNGKTNPGLHKFQAQQQMRSLAPQPAQHTPQYAQVTPPQMHHASMMHYGSGASQASTAYTNSYFGQKTGAQVPYTGTPLQMQFPGHPAYSQNGSVGATPTPNSQNGSCRLNRPILRPNASHGPYEPAVLRVTPCRPALLTQLRQVSNRAQAEAEASGRKIFIGGLRASITAEEFWSLFAEYGDGHIAWLQPRCGWVIMETPEAAAYLLGATESRQVKLEGLSCGDCYPEIRFDSHPGTHFLIKNPHLIPIQYPDADQHRLQGLPMLKKNLNEIFLVFR